MNTAVSVYFELVVPLHKTFYPVKSTPLVEAPDIANVYLCGLQDYNRKERKHRLMK